MDAQQLTLFDNTVIVQANEPAKRTIPQTTYWMDVTEHQSALRLNFTHLKGQRVQITIEVVK